MPVTKIPQFWVPVLCLVACRDVFNSGASMGHQVEKPLLPYLR